jgi:arylformamidase
MHTENWHNKQYLPSLTVKNTGDILQSWQTRSAATRAKYPFIADIKYGPHPRELIDFFRTPNAKATLIYIHGGYWSAFSKVETSFVADGFVEQGVSVALINYPLSPEVSIGDIRSSIQNAFAHLYKNVLTQEERKSIIVTGHSAGGHLAAHHLATDWRLFDLPENPVAGVICLSGVFDVTPLIETSLNEALRISKTSAEILNLNKSLIRSQAKLIFAVGGDESDEFKRQSKDQAKAWASLNPDVITLPNTNHFTIVDSLADPQATLHTRALGLLHQHNTPAKQNPQ